MTYNNLSAEAGYLNKEITKKEDDYSFVLSKTYKNGWCISRDYLTLSKATIDKHKEEKWQTIPEEYKVVDDYRSSVMGNGSIDFADKLTAIRNKTRNFYKKEFRPINEQNLNGVDEFYERKKKFGKEPISNYIASKIGNDLFDKWSKGNLSLHQISEILKVLSKFFEDEKDSLKSLSANALSEIKKKQAKQAEEEKKWKDVGIVSKLGKATGCGDKIDTIVANFSDAVKEEYTYKTWLKGYEFADDLIEDINKKISKLKKDIDGIKEAFVEVIKTVEGEISTRCIAEDEEEQNKNGLLIKNFDPLKVKEICSKAIAIKASNMQRIEELRNELLILLSKDKQNFTEAKEKLTKGSVLTTISKKALEQATSFFKLNTDKDAIEGYEQLVGINIIEKLSKEFDGNPSGLRAKFDRLIRHASVLEKHNPTEVNDGPQIKHWTFIIIPNDKNHQEFQQRVIETIRDCCPYPEYSNISVGGESNEIVVINLESMITPRYLESVRILRNAQDRLFESQHGEVARFETQLEDYEVELPSLFCLTDAEINAEKKAMQESALPYLLLAKGMGILKSKENKTTGKSILCYTPLDEDGLPDLEKEVKLSSNIEKSLEKITQDFSKTLEKEVKDKLIKDYEQLFGDIFYYINGIEVFLENCTYENDSREGLSKFYNALDTTFIKMKKKQESLRDEIPPDNL